MSVLSDRIEAFIKSMLDDSSDYVDVQRSELAGHFSCAPSQINYVLATRFTVDHGYVIESRRGGGGYIRIIRLNYNVDDYMLHLLTQRIGDALTEAEAAGIIGNLLEQGAISRREAALIQAGMHSCSLPLSAQARGQLRAGIMKSMLLSLMKLEGMQQSQGEG